MIGYSSLLPPHLIDSVQQGKVLEVYQTSSKTLRQIAREFWTTEFVIKLIVRQYELNNKFRTLV